MEPRYNFHKDNIWTSKFDVYSDIPIDAKLEYDILLGLQILEDKYSMFNDRDKSKFDANFIYEYSEYFKNNPDKLAEFCNYDVVIDYYNPTCLMKGLALKYLHEELVKNGSKSHLINFGGDVLGFNTAAHVNIDNTKFSIDKVGTFCIFTSGNTYKRGNHIMSNMDSLLPSNSILPYGTTLTLVFNNIDDPAYYDALCTRMYSGHIMDSRCIDNIIIINKDGKLDGRTYCASPFFCDREIKIRDRMIRYFEEVFRPDLTENSKSYDVGPSKELAELIYEDNVTEIDKSQYLVFPMRTNDLGTLFELGHALNIGIPVIRYDDETETYTFIDNEKMVSEFSKLDIVENSVIDCSKVQGAVVLGYFNNINTKYFLGDLNDNIMLSIMHDRVIKDDNGNYKVLPKKFVEGM